MAKTTAIQNKGKRSIMSVLEIILYSLLGAGFVTWLVITIVDTKKGKNRKSKRKLEQEQDNE